MADLLVVGAGPAGSAAAIEAARAGLSVVCIDKATFPREKCCGDGLTAGALRHLDALGLDPASLRSWRTINQVFVAGPNRKLVEFSLPQASGQFAAVARRAELDNALVELARSAGAQVRDGVGLTGLKSLADCVVASTSDGSDLAARWVVAADGMWSPTRKLLGGLGVDGYRGEWHGFRQYFKGVDGPAADKFFVWFEPDLIPGYVWSFPLSGGVANVGFGIQRGTGHRIQEMKQLWPDILSRPHIQAALGQGAKAEAAHKAWPIPARIGQLASSHGRVLFVGDAAAATDPMTGEGIGQALETGRMAVQAILGQPAPNNGASDVGVTDVGATDFAEPAKVRRRYDSQISGGLAVDHGLAGALSKILGTTVGANWSVGLAGTTAWTRRNFARWLFEDYPRAVLVTPSRWKPGLFSQPGAFRS